MLYLKTKAITTGYSVPPGTSPSIAFKTKDWGAGEVIPVVAVKMATIQNVSFKYYEIHTVSGNKTQKWYIRQGNSFTEYTPEVKRPDPVNQHGSYVPPRDTVKNDTVQRTVIQPSLTTTGLIALTLAMLGLTIWYFSGRNKERE